jgi:hypothetical protein
MPQLDCVDHVHRDWGIYVIVIQDVCRHDPIYL